MRQAIIWINGDIGYQRIYASFGLNDLIEDCYVRAKPEKLGHSMLWNISH